MEWDSFFSFFSPSSFTHSSTTPFLLFLTPPQGVGQGVRRSVVSLAQIIGPVWATLSVNLPLFWGGTLGFTALSLIILFIAWKRVLPKPFKASEVKSLLTATDDDEDYNDESSEEASALIGGEDPFDIMASRHSRRQSVN